jgi:putative membrane protein
MRKLDVFAGINTALFLMLCVFRYYARFIHYRGIEHIEEFFIYAVVILAAIVALWWVFRRQPFDTAILVLVQVGILMHFAGAFVVLDGGRLYDAHLLGIRYDKYVHFVNAFTTTMLVGRLFRFQGIPLTVVNRIFLLGMVMGCGAFIEIVEYLVVQTVPNNGVGGYDNNMQDLIANMCGALSYVLLQPAWNRRSVAGPGMRGAGERA